MTTSIVISAGRFLDLLESVTSLASDRSLNTNYVQFNVVAKTQVLQMVATDGHILSIAERPLGFATDEQINIMDYISPILKENIEWIINKIDCELLIVALKKIGVKRGFDDTEHLFYIEIEEITKDNVKVDNKYLKYLKVSVFGDCPNVILEPLINDIVFPEWKKTISDKIESLNCIAINSSILSKINKCWKGDIINIGFTGLNSQLRVTRLIKNSETCNDLIIIMPCRIEDFDKENQDQVQIVKQKLDGYDEIGNRVYTHEDGSRAKYKDIVSAVEKALHLKMFILRDKKLPLDFEKYLIDNGIGNYHSKWVISKEAQEYFNSKKEQPTKDLFEENN